MKFTFDQVINSIGLRDRILFNQQLSLMIRAGIPLARAVSELEEQTSSRALRKILRLVATDLRGGLSFADALSKHPHAFPPLVIATVRSGESSGKLVEVLERLQIQMEKDAELRSKIKSALLYPAFIAVALLAVLLLILLFVVPQLKKIFADVGISLPLITQILIGTAEFLNAYWLILMIGLIGLIALLLLSLRLPTVALWYDRSKLRFPIFGPLIQKIALARMATTAATLLSAGLPLLEVLKISQSVIDNRWYEQSFTRVIRGAAAGTSLSAILKQTHAFPAMLPNLIAVGEESGRLDETFEAVARFYEREVEATTRNLTTMIEPILMLIMGGGIGFAVASVVVPIYRLVQAV